MRKRSVKFLFLFMLVLIFISTGCSNKGTRVVFTTGLGAKDVFRIDSKVCTYSEAMVLLTNAKNKYEVMFERDLWHEDFNGLTLEDYVKEETINKLSRIKCMNLLAEEKGISLSKNEQAKAEDAAKAYYESLDEEEITYMEVDVITLVNLYQQYALGVKAYNELTGDVQDEVSDDQARIVTVQQVLVKYNNEDKDAVKKEAEKILERAKAGEDFTRLTDLNEKGVEGTFTFGRGDMPDAYVEAAFELEENQISDVIETEDGCYILKGISHLERSLTDENKENIMKERKESAFREVYDSFVEELPSEFNNELWDKITLVKDKNIVTTSFFDVYKEKFQ